MTRDNAWVRKISWKWPAQKTDQIVIKETGRRGAVAASYMWSQRDEFTEVLSNDSVWAQTKES